MKRSERWNTLQIWPRRDSNLGFDSTWYQLDHGGTSLIRIKSTKDITRIVQKITPNNIQRLAKKIRGSKVLRLYHLRRQHLQISRLSDPFKPILATFINQFQLLLSAHSNSICKSILAKFISLFLTTYTSLFWPSSFVDRSYSQAHFTHIFIGLFSPHP